MAAEVQVPVLALWRCQLALIGFDLKIESSPAVINFDLHSLGPK
jgi:hypothetical protein